MADQIRFPQPRFLHGYDAVILAPNAGLRTHHRITLRDRQIVFGGRLGGARVVSPVTAAGRFVMFLPPLDAQGEVVYRPASWQQLLEPYSSAGGIGIISLDATPRSLADALSTGDFVEVPNGERLLPPVILFPLQPARVLLAIGGVDFPEVGGLGMLLTATAIWEIRADTDGTGGASAIGRIRSPRNRAP
jgi:hypothetical protein